MDAITEFANSGSTTFLALAGQPVTPPLIRQLKLFYQQFSADHMAALDELYTPDVEFRDPIHTLHGSLALKRYLRSMATNLWHYRIDYLDECIGENSAFFTWEMKYAHPRIQRGQLQVLRGMTHVKFTSKVYYHEDCYDLGALLYEHLPVLGSATRYLKRRMSKK